MSLALDPRTTALVLIDLQNAIVSMSLSPHEGSAVVRQAAKLGRRFNELGAAVVLVNVAFAEGGVDRLSQEVDAPTRMPATSVADPSGFVADIAALKADLLITKKQWGAFFGTELDLQLRRRGITTIVLGGLATNFGVESTAREAWQHNYSVVLAEDCCSSVDAQMHRFSIEKIMPRLARVRSTEDILKALA